MSAPQTVYPPQSNPPSFASNVSGIMLYALSFRVRNPPLTTVFITTTDAAGTVASIASVFTVTVV